MVLGQVDVNDDLSNHEVSVLEMVAPFPEFQLHVLKKTVEEVIE